MQLISLFSGEGGFELAGTWAGWDVISTCEINTFCQHVLRYYWPNAYHHDNVKTLTNEIIKEKSRWNPFKPTVLVGGFPCQPFSVAGQRKGVEDERHLWPEMFRIIQECKPKWIVGENVRGFISWNEGMVFEQVQADLESEGYEIIPFVLPAAGVGAPHKRDRVWIVAYSGSAGTGDQSRKANNQERRTGQNGGTGLRQTFGQTSPSGNNSANTDVGVVTNVSDAGIKSLRSERENAIYGPSNVANATNIGQKQSGSARQWGAGFEDGNFGNENTPNAGLQRQAERKQQATGIIKCGVWDSFPTQSPIRQRNDGVPSGLADFAISEAKWRNESIHAHGNAVVPQIPYLLFQVINQLEAQGF